MKIAIENIRKSPLTTAVGAIILLAGLVSVFIPKVEVSWAEAIVPIGMGVTLMLMKDSKASGGNSAKFIIGLLILSLLHGGCSTIRVPGNKDRASRVIAKNVRQNKAIAQAFPGLVDSTKVKLEIPGLDKDTVFVDVLDTTSYERLKLLESQFVEGCDPELVIKWKETVKELPRIYKEGTYNFEGDRFKSYVTLSGGKILNRVKVAPMVVTVPGEPVITEIEKTKPLDLVLRVVSGVALIFILLRFVIPKFLPIL